MKSDVYFTDLHTGPDCSRLDRLDKLIRGSGLDRIDMEKKFVAIKIHFGEYGNLAYIRHNYVPVLARFIREKGGIPFLTDCNTLYIGRRKNAIEHLDTANGNGFTPYTTGCQLIIGDGLKGDDDVEVPINGEFVRNAKIGRAIHDADVIITMSHFKCHEEAGIGGAIKNLGMGCASRRGKMEQHNTGKPTFNRDVCRGCRECVKHCGSDAISFVDKKAVLDREKCVGCGMCIAACRFDAITVDCDEGVVKMCQKMAEYAAAAVLGKPNFHISMVTDVSPHCDCHGGNDVAVVPDVGFFASYDPVALDQACSEAVMRQPVMKGSLADNDSDRDLFGKVTPITDWTAGLVHAEKIGLGTREYNLIKLK